MSGNHNMYCSANELADADDVIHKLQSLSEAYPTDIFPEIIEQDIEYINAVNQNLSARFFAHVGRHFIKKGFEPAITMLRQQQAEIQTQYDLGFDAGCKHTKKIYEAEIEVLKKKIQNMALDLLSAHAQADDHWVELERLRKATNE